MPIFFSHFLVPLSKNVICQLFAPIDREFVLVVQAREEATPQREGLDLSAEGWDPSANSRGHRSSGISLGYIDKH